MSQLAPALLASAPPLTASALDRFVSFIRFSGDHWCWTGPTGRSRGGTVYGRFSIDGVQYGAHRLSYAWFKGLLRRADLVLHTCHVPLCVNPDHLYRGSHARNMRDRNQARRQARGERHGHAKLTAAQVTAIRAATGTPTEIGRRFGLSRSHVANIRAGRIWSDAA